MKKLKFISVLLAMLTAFSCLSAFSTSAAVTNPISSIEIAEVPSNIYEKSVEEMLYGVKIKVNYADSTTQTYEVSVDNVEYESNLDYLYTHAFSRSMVDVTIDDSTRINIESYNYVGDFIQINATAYQGEADEYSYEAKMNFVYPDYYDLPEIFCCDYLVYRNNPDNTLTLINHAFSPEYFIGGDMESAIVIPEDVNGKTVTSIADYALLGTTHPLSITIPGTVTSIGKYAFGYCFAPGSSGDNHYIPDNVMQSRLAYKLAEAEDDERFFIRINFYSENAPALSDKLLSYHFPDCTDYIYYEDLEIAYVTITKEQIYSMYDINEVCIELLYEQDSNIAEEIYDFAEYTGYAEKMVVWFDIFGETEAEQNEACAEISELYFGGRTDYIVDHESYTMRINATFDEIKAASQGGLIDYIYFGGVDGVSYDLYKKLFYEGDNYRTDVFVVDNSYDVSQESYTAYADTYFAGCDYEVYSFEGQEVLTIKDASKQQILGAEHNQNLFIDLFGYPLLNTYDNIVICGEKGSAAQTYADNNLIQFINTSIEYELGDVDLDGIITISDATEILKYNVGIITFTDEQKALADFDKNGAINVSDATAIQKVLAGL